MTEIMNCEDFFFECKSAKMEHEGVITHLRIGDHEYQLYNCSEADASNLQMALYRLGVYETHRRIEERQRQEELV